MDENDPQEQKNKFFLELRKYLQLNYSADSDQYYERSEWSQAVHAGAGAERISQNPPKARQEVHGFYFRKDLCRHRPYDTAQMLDEIRSFAAAFDRLESIVNKEDNRITLNICDAQYELFVHIDEDDKGEIGVRMSELPRMLSDSPPKPL